MKILMMGKKLTYFVIAGLIALSAGCAADRAPDSEMRSGQVDSIDEKGVSNAFAGREGAFVLIDCATGEISDFYPESSSGLLPPCSTFKIWNALIGLELGIIAAADEAFYQWDGQTRAISAWNMDLTLKEAFQASCVPAFQALARQIGQDRMQLWIDKLGYGDGDLSAGIDIFWLPAKGRKTILISPLAQARLMCRLVSGELPFSKTSLTVLKEMMIVKKTDKGVLFGKTGSGSGDGGEFTLGWFVGYVETGEKTFAFACSMQGKGLMGKDARAVVETVLEHQRLL